MPFTLILPDGYGYCAAIALGVIPFMSFVHGTVVGSKRKEAKVPYPNAYATPEQMKADKKAHTFNCAQRAHGQFMENAPQTMFYILFAGAFYPMATTYLALFWVLSRIIYAYGYITAEKPGGRLWGSGFWLAQGALWGMSIYAALTQLL